MAMAKEAQGTTPKALWVLIVAGPVIVAFQHQTNFILVRQACSMQRNLALYAVTIVAIVLTIATVLVAVSIWRRAGAAWPEETADLPNNVRFVAVLGLLSSAMSLLVIIAQGIATMYFDPCQL